MRRFIRTAPVFRTDGVFLTSIVITAPGLAEGSVVGQLHSNLGMDQVESAVEHKHSATEWGIRSALMGIGP